MRWHYKIFFSVLILFILGLILSTWNFGNDEEIIWGTTFSKKQAQEFGLDWKKLYQKTLDELNLQVIRLPIYWSDVEVRPDEFNFEDYVWMVNRAAEKNIEIVPVIGRRVPRWPECHTPEFYKDLTEPELQNRILILLQQEVQHFKNYENIKKWQVDNEPFLDLFGECPPADSNLIEREVRFVRNLDARPIIITESGELSTWLPGAKLTDILGISMYRQTYNDNWGYFAYPFLPSFYLIKSGLVKMLTGVEEVINTELQVEPWGKDKDLTQVNLFDQFYVMDLDQVKTNIKFARRSGISEIYLWGVEWWYWLGEKHGHWEFWEYGKQLTTNN